MDHPSRVGKYEIEVFLGGGMSRVYRAKDEVLGRRVALKILADAAATDVAAKARFLEEARLASSIAHENIISVYDFGEDQGRSFMVMEFVEGESLRHAIENDRSGDYTRRMQIALFIGRAIDHIHSKNIVHRDIKPENVHIDLSGCVKLMDFGIAKLQGVNADQTGFTLGTPFYMSPEQVLGQDATTQSDVYSFGVLLYELLAGRKPFEAATVENIFEQILYQPLNLEPLYEAQVPPLAIDLISKCMTKAPAERPHGLAVVCGAMEGILGPASMRLKPVAVPLAPPAGSNGLPEFLQNLPAPLRTQAGLMLVAGAATLGVLAVLFVVLRLARLL